MLSYFSPNRTKSDAEAQTSLTSTSLSGSALLPSHSVSMRNRAAIFQEDCVGNPSASCRADIRTATAVCSLEVTSRLDILVENLAFTWLFFIEAAHRITIALRSTTKNHGS